MAYATVDDVAAGFRALTLNEQNVCARLLDEAALIIDAYNVDAPYESKNTVSCRMVRRSLGDSSAPSVPIGATQGTVSALGYSQSWTMGGGSSGELYLSKIEKKLLGVGNKIGAYSPLEDMTYQEVLGCSEDNQSHC